MHQSAQHQRTDTPTDPPIIFAKQGAQDRTPEEWVSRNDVQDGTIPGTKVPCCEGALHPGQIDWARHACPRDGIRRVPLGSGCWR
jgi:hypothetical protein